MWRFWRTVPPLVQAAVCGRQDGVHQAASDHWHQRPCPVAARAGVAAAAFQRRFRIGLHDDRPDLTSARDTYIQAFLTGYAEVR